MENIKYYKISPQQKVVLLQCRFSLHGGLSHLPVLITINKPFNFDILKQAINLEIERNDAARLRFVKKRGEVFQYFGEPYKIENIPIVDFSEKTKEDQEKYIAKFGMTHMKYLKNELIRASFIKTFDDKTAFLISGNHIAFDAAGMFICIQDILNIYFALMGEAEFPKPLDKYEEFLEIDNKYYENPEISNKNIEFHMKILKEGTPVSKFSEPIDRRLYYPPINEKKKANTKYNLLKSIINDKTGHISFHINPTKVKSYINFCEKNLISMQNLFMLAIVAYLSKMNNSDDIVFSSIFNRRATLREKNSSGSRASGSPLRIQTEENENCFSIINKCKEAQMRVYRRPETNPVDFLKRYSGELGLSMANYHGSIYFSFIPVNYTPPEGNELEAIPISCGRGAAPLYVIAIPSIKNDGLDIFYEYQLRLLTEEQIKAFHEGINSVFDAIIKNPEISFSEIKKSIK